MSATELWLLVAAIAAGLAAVLQLGGTYAAPTTAGLIERLGRSLVAVAIALIAVALILALP